MTAEEAVAALRAIRQAPEDFPAARLRAIAIINSVHPADPAADRAFADAVAAIPLSRK